MQKVFKTGNSLAVTVPVKFAKDLGVRQGDAIKVEVRQDKGTLTYHFQGVQQLPISQGLFKREKKD